MGSYKWGSKSPNMGYKFTHLRTLCIQACLLGGSWVVMSGVLSPLIRVISIVTHLITLLILPMNSRLVQLSRWPFILQGLRNDNVVWVSQKIRARPKRLHSGILMIILPEAGSTGLHDLNTPKSPHACIDFTKLNLTHALLKPSLQ